MKLIYFLTIGGILSLILGEFGQYPFGTTKASISLIDILVGLSVFLLAVWKIGIKGEVKLPKISFILMSFWTVGFFSLLVNWDFRGYLYLIRFILYSGMFLVGYFIVNEDESLLDNLLKIIVKVICVFAVVGLVQLLVYPDFKFLTDYGYDPHIGRLASSFLDPNFAALFLNIGMILSGYLYLKEKDKSWLFYCLLIFISVILTFSRGGWVVLLLGSFSLLFVWSKKLLGLFLVGLVLLVLLVPRINERVKGGFNLDVTSKERVESWQKGISVFTKQPILGVGFNNTRYAFEKNNLVKIFSSDGGNSGSGVDSSFIFILMTTGIVGGLIYMSFWGYVLKEILTLGKDFYLRLYLTVLLMGVFIGSQFINGLFYPPIMFLLFLITGGVVGYKKS